MRNFVFFVITLLLAAGCSNNINGPKGSDSFSSTSDNEVTDSVSNSEKTDTNVQDSENITDKENVSDAENSTDIEHSDSDNNEIPDNEEIPDVDNVINHYTASCAEVLIYNPDAPDGEYTLYAENNPEKPWTAYCADINSTPADYLVLAKTGSGFNFSAYAAGGGSSGTDVITLYNRIRIDPSTFVVTTGDQRFATSSGEASQGDDAITSMPYGTASDCRGDSNTLAIANIDLTGTPFTVNDTFCTDGYQPNGEAVFSTSNIVVNITGGGYCGWTTPCPSVSNPYNTNGSELQLSYGFGN